MLRFYKNHSGGSALTKFVINCFVGAFRYLQRAFMTLYIDILSYFLGLGRVKVVACGAKNCDGEKCDDESGEEEAWVGKRQWCLMFMQPDLRAPWAPGSQQWNQQQGSMAAVKGNNATPCAHRHFLVLPVGVLYFDPDLEWQVHSPSHWVQIQATAFSWENWYKIICHDKTGKTILYYMIWLYAALLLWKDECNTRSNALLQGGATMVEATSADDATLVLWQFSPLVDKRSKQGAGPLGRDTSCGTLVRASPSSARDTRD